MADKEVLFSHTFYNPLEEQVGEKFFQDLPKKPGVYKMVGSTGTILYVGKSVNLRNRLFTYRRANFKNSCKKTLRLVKMVHKIDYDICRSDQEALLKENELIRRYKPSFNRAKKTPERYYYLSHNQLGETFKIQLGMHMPDNTDGEMSIYGAFKGHGVIRSGTGALLRQLYLLEYSIESPFNFPSILINKFTPLTYTIPVKRGIVLEESFLRLLHQYLSGGSLQFLSRLTEIINSRNLLDKFIGKLILRDLKSMKIFFRHNLKRNRKLIDKLELKEHLIPQEKLDDYLVKAAFIDEKRKKL